MRSLSVFVVSALLALPVAAKDALSAKDIVDKALAKGGALAFKQGTATLRMTIVNKRKEAKTRTLDLKVLRPEDGLSKTLVRFSKPVDIAGTAFMVHEQKDALPKSWVYLPALKKVRPISAGNTTGSFFGSDFTFADLMPLPKSEIDKVKLTRLDDKDVGGAPAYAVQIEANQKGAPYSKVIFYVHQKTWLPVQVEFFDKKGKPLKRMRVKRVKTIRGHKVPTEIQMKNLQKGTQTVIELKRVDPNARLKDEDFTEQAMAL